LIIYLVGISCVGKTTIGKMLAKHIGFTFLDIDMEVEKHYLKSIERIQYEGFTMNGFRKKASVVLDDILTNADNLVIAGTPSGLKYSYLQVYKRHKTQKDLFSIHIRDSHENVLKRLTFYDKDSKPIMEELDETKKKRYLMEIKADYNYFKDSYKRADLQIDIENIKLDNIPNIIMNELHKMNRMPAANRVDGSAGVN